MADDESRQPQQSLNDIVEHTRFNFWKATAPSPTEDKLYSESADKYYHYEAWPLATTVPFGTLAVLLLVGQLFVHGTNWNVAWPGWVRLAMLMAGALCAFIAWPRHRDLRSTPEEEASAEEMRERFARLRFGGKE